MCSGLKLPFAIHLSRTVMDTVHIHKVIWTLAKHMSSKRRPSTLSRTKNGMEDGLCMAARAFSNVQSTIWNKTKNYYYKRVRLVMRGIKVSEEGHGVLLTHLPRMCEPWCTKCLVCSCSVNWSCLPFKSWKRNEGWSNLAWMHSTCAKWHQGGNRPDWMAHLEEVGPWQEVKWHHCWTNRKRVSHGKTHRGA